MAGAREWAPCQLGSRSGRCWESEGGNERSRELKELAASSTELQSVPCSVQLSLREAPVLACVLAPSRASCFSHSLPLSLSARHGEGDRFCSCRVSCSSSVLPQVQLAQERFLPEYRDLLRRNLFDKVRYFTPPRLPLYSFRVHRTPADSSACTTG